MWKTFFSLITLLGGFGGGHRPNLMQCDQFNNDENEKEN
jgi:hypothetical protein